MNEPHPNTVPEFEPEDFLSSLFRTAKCVLLGPGPFFDRMNRDGGLKNPFLFLISCVLVHAVLGGLFVGNPGQIVRNLALGIGFPFLTAGILFAIITNVFKAPGTYEMAFRVNAYAAAVSLLSWIPMIGLVLELYRVYLLVVGLRCTFSIKSSQAFLAVLLTFVLYIMASGAIAHLTGGPLPQTLQ